MSYFERNVRYQPLDAVNLIFYGIDLTTVKSVLDGAGWKTHTIQSHEYLSDADAWLVYEQSYRVKAKGPKLPDMFTRHLGRYHVRLWMVTQDRIVGAAHEEDPALFPPSHRVASFNSGRNEVANDFDAVSSYKVLRKAVYIGTKIKDTENDGWATVIST